MFRLDIVVLNRVFYTHFWFFSLFATAAISILFSLFAFLLAPGISLLRCIPFALLVCFSFSLRLFLSFYPGCFCLKLFNKSLMTIWDLQFYRISIDIRWDLLLCKKPLFQIEIEQFILLYWTDRKVISCVKANRFTFQTDLNSKLLASGSYCERVLVHKCIICLSCIHPFTSIRRKCNGDPSGELKWQSSIVIYVQYKTSKLKIESKTNSDTMQRYDYFKLSIQMWTLHTQEGKKTQWNHTIDWQKHVW